MSLAQLLKLLSYLPLRALHALGAWTGWLAQWAPTRSRRNVWENIPRCFPELTAEQQRRMVRATLIETAKSFLETAALWNWPGPKVLGLIREVIGSEVLDQAMARGRGVIIVMPHLGSWELAASNCSSLQPMTTLYKPPGSAALEAMMLAGRQRFGARLVPTDAKGLRALYQALARGETVGILPDQNPRPGTGIHVPFFGQQTYTMTLVGRLIQKSGAEVIYAYAERLSRGAGFRMHLRAAGGTFEGLDLKALTARVNADIEACVREVPTQYQWTYRRFKFTPAELAKHNVFVDDETDGG